MIRGEVDPGHSSSLAAALPGAGRRRGRRRGDQSARPDHARAADRPRRRGRVQRSSESAPGEPYVVREDGLGDAQAGRAERRLSIAYFGQLSDFQLADEESPARVEFVDPIGSPVEAAFRPWEALNPHIDDAMVRQVNAFAAASPVPAGDGSRAARWPTRSRPATSPTASS